MITKLKVKLVMPWWTSIYLGALSMFCFLLQTEPDPIKVSDFILKHTKTKMMNDD